MAAGFRSTEQPCRRRWRRGAAHSDDDGDVELVPQAAPSSALAAAAQPPPVDEGDVDLAVLKTGLLPDDDGNLDYQQAAETLRDEDNFVADADSENAYASVHNGQSALDLVKGPLLHKKKPLNNASSRRSAPAPFCPSASCRLSCCCSCCSQLSVAGAAEDLPVDDAIDLESLAKAEKDEADVPPAAPVRISAAPGAQRSSRAGAIDRLRGMAADDWN